MGRIIDFFGAPPRRNMQIPLVPNPRPIKVPLNRPNDGRDIRIDQTSLRKLPRAFIFLSSFISMF